MTQFGIPPSGNMVNFQPPSYNPLAGPGFTSNPLFQLAMSMYLPQAMGQGNFLPSLAPSQHLFDQFTAAKYQNSRMQGMAGAQAIDQQALTTRMLGLQAATTDAPMTAMNVEQASNMASIVNHPLAKMVVGQLMGPENMEDLYYGRRGSAEMLYQSVAKSGFHRRDPTGGERMSAESLSGMTREMYAQMYGPDADLSKMNGLSAGRAGVLYDDLFRRGVLPQSIGNLTPAERVKAIAEDLPTDDKTMERLAREFGHEQLLRSDQKLLDGKTYAELTPQQQQAHVSDKLPEYRKQLGEQFQAIRDYNNQPGTGQKSIGEIEQMEGFGIAARSIDAQKVSGTLKQYSGAIAAVREIFGDNGNPNAPMQQLITALEALTQNQIGRVSPKKIEQQVREMQMAARGAGVGIQGMLALSSQAAAFGDQLGLDRSFANTSTLAGMRQGEAMRNAGAINRGFGGMSQEEAMVKGAYLESAAAASPIGNMIGVAVRTVKEDPDTHYNPDGTAKTSVGAMVQALERGDTTYKDPTTGKTVDIQQGLADKQSAFIRDELDKSVDKRLTEERMLDRQGNQEFTSYVKDISRITQRADITGDMASTFDNQLSLEQKGFGDKDRRQIGKATAEAVMATHSGIAPEKRAAHMREKIMQNLIQTEEATLAQTSPNLTPEERRKEATQRANTKFSKAFGHTQEQQTQEMVRMLAQGNRMLTAVGADAGMTMYNLKDFFGSDVQENKARLQAAQSRRAELMGDFGDTQSTMLQRFSDVLGGLGSGNKTTMQQAVQAMLGVIPNSQISDAMRPGVGAIFQLAGEEYNRGLVVSEEELITLRQTAQGSDATAAAEAKEKLRKFAGEKGKGVEDVNALFDVAVHESANKKVAGGERNIGLSREIVRGIELGGSAGVSRASGALAQSLLGQAASKDSVNALADALRSGDEKKVTSLLPASITGDQSDAGKQRMRQILSAAGALKQLDESGRGLGEMDSQKISDARLRTVRDVVSSGDEAMLSQTEEGRRLIAMSKADAQGNYTLADGKKRNVHTDLGGGEKEDAEKFKRDLQAAAKSADQKTKDKVDAVLQQGAADPAKQAAAAAQTIQQAAAGGAAGAPGSISSATITIERLEHLHVQNATGLQMPAGTAGRVTGSADVAATQTPTSVAATENQKNNKKKDDVFSAFTGALTHLGRIAHIGNVPLQDILSGAAKLAPDLQKQATDFLTQAYNAATKVNASTKSQTSTPPNAETKRAMWSQLSDKEREQVSFIRDTDAAKKLEEKGDDYAANIKRKAANKTLETIATKEIAEENPGQPVDSEKVRRRTELLRERAKDNPASIISQRAQEFVDYERGKPAAKTEKTPDAKEREYDIDPKEFTQSMSQADGAYTSIRSGAFRDKDGRPISKPTNDAYFDAIHTVKRQKDDPQHRTGRVGQIGDKYYEEYLAGGVAPAYREVTVGPKARDDKKEAASLAQKQDEIARASQASEGRLTPQQQKEEIERAAQVTQQEQKEKAAEVDHAMISPFNRKDRLVGFDSKHGPVYADEKGKRYQVKDRGDFVSQVPYAAGAPIAEDFLEPEKAAARGPQTFTPADKLSKEQREEIARLQKLAGYTAEQSREIADDKRAEVVAKAQSAEAAKLDRLDTTMQQSWNDLTPSQKKEVDYFQTEKKVNEAKAVIEDPSAPPDKKAAASKIIEERTQEKSQKDVERIVAMKMFEEQGVKINSDDFNVNVTGTGADPLTTSVTANGKKLDQFEFLARVKQYNADNSLSGVSDEAITHMTRVQQKDEQEGFTKSQDQQAVEGKQDQKQTEEKQQQADSKAETKQRDLTLAVPTVEERKEAKAEVDRAEVAKQVVTAEQQSGRLTAAGGMGGGGAGSGEQELTGTLQLRGLTEVLLAARSKQMELPPDNGPAVDPAQGQGGYATVMG